MNTYNMVNINAFRCHIREKIRDISNFLEGYDPLIVCIQEIDINSALQVFDGKFQVFCNIEKDANDGVGIVSLVRRDIVVRDMIIGINGRIIGLKIGNAQIWNVYPKSGTAYKNEREKFFREDLTELFTQWKDQSKYIFQIGDHNFTHRIEDSLYNGAQHLQKCLVSHLQLHGMSDDFLRVHGGDMIMYSRVTERSKTRIDYIFSNTNACIYFQYVPLVGFDHRVALAQYELEMEVINEVIPVERYSDGWVINRNPGGAKVS